MTDDIKERLNDIEERLVLKIEKEAGYLHDSIRRVEDRFAGIHSFEEPWRKLYGTLILALLLLILWRAW